MTQRQEQLRSETDYAERTWRTHVIAHRCGALDCARSDEYESAYVKLVADQVRADESAFQRFLSDSRTELHDESASLPLVALDEAREQLRRERIAELQSIARGDADERAHAAHDEREHERMMRECGVSISMGPTHDPYGTSCERDAGHDGAHEGSHPLGVTPLERIRWTGGGSCAGDALPFHVTR